MCPFFKKRFYFIYFLAIFIPFALGSFHQAEDKILFHIVNPQKTTLKFYWKDEKGETFKSISALKNWLDKKNEKLVFAMNGGMYKKDNSPQGLFIEGGKTKTETDTSSGSGNFFLKPNGILFLRKNNTAGIVCTPDFASGKDVTYATQSGPMLVIDGKIHPKFTKGSENINIRNGAGILPNGQIIFAMSTVPVNFYDFAIFFKNKGCKNALYLDGFVSRTYLPTKNFNQLDGNFGVIIGETE